MAGVSRSARALRAARPRIVVRKPCRRDASRGGGRQAVSASSTHQRVGALITRALASSVAMFSPDSWGVR